MSSAKHCVSARPLHGKNIVHILENSNNLHFFYDAQNRPAVVDFNGVKYAYIVNLQGDVLGLVDSNGNEVVKYNYDAWGKVLSTTGSLASTLGIIQPFRYREYVYDVDTGLYYLRSRYYNPVWGRFVTADIVLDSFSEIINNNIYLYCKNSPVILSDFDGFVWVLGAYAPFYGFYHLQVQLWIVNNNPNVVMEKNTSTGRIDLYKVRMLSLGAKAS